MSAVGLELQRSLVSLEPGLELPQPSQGAPSWVDLLDLSSMGLLEANPEMLSEGDELLVAVLVQDLEEGLVGGLLDQQSDILDTNRNSSK